VGAALVAAAAEPASLEAQAARLHGIVLDSAANRPLGDVRVRISGTQFTTRTSADGRFSISVPAGRVVLVAQRPPTAATARR
jgi:carboxypeptidase family protein